MIKVKITISRAEVSAMIDHLRQSEVWASDTNRDMTIRFNRIVVGCILYALRVTLNHKLARYRTQHVFTYSLTREQACAFMLYYKGEPLPADKYDAVLIKVIAGKIDPKLQ